MDGGSGATHRERRRRGKGSLVGHEVGNNIAMVRSLCELEWGKGERRGVRYRDEGEKPRADEGAGKRRTYSAKGETSAAPCRGHASATHVSPATDGFHRTRSDNDPARVEQSPGTGATSHRCSKHSRLQES
jgi:hypothetical protein